MIIFNGLCIEFCDDGLCMYLFVEKCFFIGVVIYEVGYIYFFMIVNFDECQWIWMDEGLNSFLDGVVGCEWDFMIFWGVELCDIIGYMKFQIQVLIMIQFDLVFCFGLNVYIKFVVVFNIFCEIIFGCELFDFVFKEYVQCWMFKCFILLDFFCIMEEVLGVDLDWFWCGWFYIIDYVDISLDSVYKFCLDIEDLDIDFVCECEVEMEKLKLFIDFCNKEEGKKFWVDCFEDISDFYDENDCYIVINKECNKYKKFLKDFEFWECKVFECVVKEDKNYYVLDFSNKGGLVMLIIFELMFEDGMKEEMCIFVEIWCCIFKVVSKFIVIDKDKELVSVIVDLYWEIVDVDVENNYYLCCIIFLCIEVYKNKLCNIYEYCDFMYDLKIELKIDDEDKDDE